MRYIDQQEALEKTLAKMPEAVTSLFPERTVISLIEEVCAGFEVTFGETGEICELVRQIITKELEPKDFETKLTEKLDEDNQPKVGDIVMALSEKLFAKLLPALGIKVPIEMAIRTGTSKVEGIESAQFSPKQIPLKRMPFRMPDTNPIPQPAVQPKPFVPPATEQLQTPVRVMPPQPAGTYPSTLGTGAPNTKPPIIETSHEALSYTPIDSLMKMLEGRIQKKELASHFEKLPPSLRVALNSIDSAKKVVDIGRKYALHMDKLGELGAETGMVILGFTHPGQFLPRLTRRLNIPEEKVRPIAQEINSEIFLKIREALKEVNGEVVEPKPTGGIPIKPKPPTPPKPQSSSAPVEPKKEEPAKPDNILGDDITILPQISNDTPNGPEEVLDRGTILKNIENPSLLQGTSAGSVPETQKEPSFVQVEEPSPKIAPLPVNTPPEAPARETSVPVVPTTRQNFPPPSPQTPPPYAKIPENLPGSAEPAPFDFSDTPKPKPATDIASKKLSEPTTSAKSESSYTLDPYREPLA